MIVIRGLDTSALPADAQRLGTKLLPPIVRAINRTAKNVNTAMVRTVAKSLGIKQAYVRERLSLESATWSKPFARLSASTKPIPVIAFNARGPEPSRGRGRGVTATTTTRRYPHAFLARMRSGHRGVFERVGATRLKIRELKEASVAAVFLKHAAVGQARADEQLPKNLEHEVSRALQRA